MNSVGLIKGILFGSSGEHNVYIYIVVIYELKGLHVCDNAMKWEEICLKHQHGEIENIKLHTVIT